jgi:hypothetical protein
MSIAALASVVMVLTPPMPLAPVSATGDSWVIATASGSPMQAAGHDLALPDLLKPGFESSVEGSTALASSHAATHALLARNGISWRLVAGGSADAECHPTSSAFGRADVSTMIDFDLARAGRVNVTWDLLATGIANGVVIVQQLPVAPGSTTWLEVSVSSYIVPDSETGSVVLDLPAGSHRLRFYGTVQANSGFENPDEGGYSAAIELTAMDAPDLNGDGMVNGADLGALLAAWDTPAADLTGDGTTDGADLGLLLAAWEV